MTRYFADLRVEEPVEPESERIDAELLIPGKGEPIRNGTLVFKDGKIEFAGAQKDVPIHYASTKAKKVKVLMPGMWDCHAHFMGFSTMNLEQWGLASQALGGIRAVRDVAACLNAGITSCREMGGYGSQLAIAINEGWIPGPHIYSSVGILSQTAGHGDLHSLPLNWVQGEIAHGLPLGLCDGVDECIKMVRLQVRRGAQVIKICATGGVLSLIDSPHAPEFSPAEIEAIVQEAERTGLIVGAHAHGTRGIINALKAGVKTIEHGSYLTEEAINLMKEKDAILIATRTIVEYGQKNLGDLPPEPRRKMKEIGDAHKASFAAAVKAGVKCALGTDLGCSSKNVALNHGMNGQEFYWATVAGMSNLQAIEAGTATAPLTLGPRAPMSGQLKEGYDADFIGLDENPLDDIKVLANPDAVKYVWKGGRMYKSPGNPVNIFV